MAPDCSPRSYDPGRNYPDESVDAAAGCGQPPAKRHSSSKANRRSFAQERLRSGFRLKAPGTHVPHAFKAPQFAGDHTARDHPFPSRTRKLSLAGPMVLHGRLCGRLGDRRQLYSAKSHPPRRMAFLRLDGLFCVLEPIVLLLVREAQVPLIRAPSPDCKNFSVC